MAPSDVPGLRAPSGSGAPAVALLFSVLFSLLASFPASAQGDTPFMTLPRFGSNDEPDIFLYFEHKAGSGYLTEGLRRSPTQLRSQRLPENLFEQIGRNVAAIHGELLMLPIFAGNSSVRDALFVETSTGYMVYLDEFGKNDKLGNLVTVIGRPFGPLAAADGNFVLLQRRDGSGKTDGAYLYHGTTGRGMYISGLAKLEVDLKPLTTVELPKFERRFAAAELISSDGTVGYLLVAANTGKVTLLDLVAGQPERLAIRETSLELLTGFAADTLNPSLQRFVLEPLQENGTTRSVLVIDVASGQIGLIDDPLTQPRLRILQQNVYSVLRPGAGENQRTFATVRNGKDGVWVLDSLSASMIYIENPLSPADLRIYSVGIQR